MKANSTLDWRYDVYHYHTFAYSTFSLTCNVVYIQVTKREHEDSIFLLVIIFPTLRAGKELIWNGLVA